MFLPTSSIHYKCGQKCSKWLTVPLNQVLIIDQFEKLIKMNVMSKKVQSNFEIGPAMKNGPITKVDNMFLPSGSIQGLEKFTNVDKSVPNV